MTSEWVCWNSTNQKCLRNGKNIWQNKIFDVSLTRQNLSTMTQEQEQKLWTIIYTIWSVMDHIPTQTQLSMIKKILKRDLLPDEVEANFEIASQHPRPYLSDLLFWEHIRTEGIDREIHPDQIFDWWEQEIQSL